ncbi:MAG: hypothetical protein AABY10_05835, partial [Nanoarchaeota archaeon]
MDDKMKKGQVTIMIIVAIAIVAFILIFFLLKTKIKIDLPGGSESVFDYESYAKKCVRDYTEEALDLMIKQGGFLQPKNGKLFNNTNIEYLCYSKANYEKCVNQHPLLIKEMKIELKEYLGPKIKECLLDM